MRQVWLILGWLFFGVFHTHAEPVPPPLLLANVHADVHDPSQYWISEKLDGVRAYWDGEALWFRSGRPIHAPDWFTAGFPKTRLDGELWMGRGAFEALSGIVRKETPVDAEWRKVRYQLFELPGAAGDFSTRIAQMTDLVASANVAWLGRVEQFRVKDRRELQQRLAAVVREGGEGLMLHRADALWESGRSDTLLKLKPWLDAEAEVVGHQPGKGKYAGMLGALKVRTPEGVTFALGSGLSDAQRRTPPELGSRVTYRYRAINPNGVPRFAVFLRVRQEP